MSAIATAPTTPVSCVLAPAASATGVREAAAHREALEETPATLAVPSATSSWFASTR